jgi:hypothetical protein
MMCDQFKEGDFDGIRSRVFLEKLIVTQLVKKFPNLYGTQRFINVFTKPPTSEAV